METFTLKKIASQRLRNGEMKLEEADFIQAPKRIQGQEIRLLDHKKNYLANAYLGIENRTIAWVSSFSHQPLDQKLFKHLFEKAKEFRQPFYQNLGETNAFRVFNGDGDGLGGLVIDYYNGYYILSWYNQGIIYFKEAVLNAFQEVFPDAVGLYEKHNYPKAKIQSHHSLGQEAPAPHIILENGVRFATYLNEGWMTGIFLDQRDVRRNLMNQYGIGNTILNLFSYTGAFSVVSAMGGATKTVSVDLANRSKEFTEEQFHLNQLNLKNHEIRVIDVHSYVDYAQKHHLRFDVIVIDPPTFARSKKGTWNVEENYSDLINECLDLLADKGMLIVSTNAWKVSRDDFLDIVKNGFDANKSKGQIIDEYRLPNDFKTNSAYPESNYLKVFVLEKTNE